MEGRIKDYTTTVLILESITDGVFILNSDGRIEYANKSSLDLLGAKFDEVKGKFIDEFLVDSTELNRPGVSEDEEECPSLLEKLRNGIFRNIECYLVNKQNVTPVLVTFNPIKSKKGEVEYIIVIVNDISDIKAMEKELKKSQVIAVSRDRLRALGELTVGLIHQISHPLNAMHLRLDMLKSRLKEKGKISTDKLLSCIKDIDNMINKMVNIINSMRLFAQQTEDNVLEIVNIQEVIENVVSMFMYELKNLDIELIVEHRKDIPYILANPLLIEQVLINLVSNARDAFIYNPKKRERDRRIRIRTGVNPGKWVEIYVEDNAGGIDRSVLDRIWEPFFTTKEIDRNSGIGLTMCKNIIDSIGGNIKVGVRDGESTIFKVILPIEQKSETQELRNLIEIFHRG